MVSCTTHRLHLPWNRLQLSCNAARRFAFLRLHVHIECRLHSSMLRSLTITSGPHYNTLFYAIADASPVQRRWHQEARQHFEIVDCPKMPARGSTKFESVDENEAQLRGPRTSQQQNFSSPRKDPERTTEIRWITNQTSAMKAERVQCKGTFIARYR